MNPNPVPAKSCRSMEVQILKVHNHTSPTFFLVSTSAVDCGSADAQLSNNISFKKLRTDDKNGNYMYAIGEQNLLEKWGFEVVDCSQKF
jgi:hypothetical protein